MSWTKQKWDTVIGSIERAAEHLEKVQPKHAKKRKHVSKEAES